MVNNVAGFSGVGGSELPHATVAVMINSAIVFISLQKSDTPVTLRAIPTPKIGAFAGSLVSVKNGLLR